MFVYIFVLFQFGNSSTCAVYVLHLYEQDFDVFCMYVSVYNEFDMHSTGALRETLSFPFDSQISFISANFARFSVCI